MKPKLELSIDELVLHGFSARDSRRIGRAIEFELTRLINEKGLPAGFSNEISIPHLNFESSNLKSDSRPNVIGHQIASSLYSGLQNN